MKEKIRQFMIGRYGTDGLNQFLNIASLVLVLAYILTILVVQAARFIKRFYVRRFANNINRRMKGIVNKSSCTLRGLL